MKNASFVKNNKSKINSSHPYSFKEINSTPNYLYMQIKSEKISKIIFQY